MKPSRIFFTRGPWWLLVCAACLAVPAGASGAEPYQQMLDALRQNKLFDTGLDYLDLMAESDLISDEDALALPFERGRFLVGAAREEPDFTRKNARLDDARAQFEAFLADQPQHVLAAQAEMQLGLVLVERGNALLTLAGQPSRADDKDDLMKQARDYFTRAQPIFEAAEVKFDEQYRQFPKDPDLGDAQRNAQREQVHTNLINSRMYSAGVLFEMGRSYPAASAEAADFFKKAAGKYADIYRAYRLKRAGWVAFLRQGECYQELGDIRQALGIYTQVLLQPPDELIRDLRTLALHRALQCWTSESQNKYEEAAAEGQRWLDEPAADSDRSPDAMAVRYFTALALSMKAAALPEDQASERATLTSSARRLAAQVMKYPGQYREAARELAQSLAGAAQVDLPDPTTFADALSRGREALDTFDGLRANLAELEAQGGASGEADRMHGEVEAAGEEAIRLLWLATALRDDETLIEDVNIVRASLAYLFFRTGRRYDAAVLGEFLARHYPQDSSSPQSAMIALNVYAELYSAAQDESRAFYRTQIERMAALVAKAWPGEAEADAGWHLLINLAVGERDFDQAIAHLAQIPEPSAWRADSEITVGLALAAAASEALRQPSDEGPSADVDRWQVLAQQYLQSGLDRSRAAVEAGSEVEEAAVKAALALAGIFLRTGQGAQAVTVLYDPALGPVTLAKAQQAVVASGPLARLAYELAVQACVATQALEQASEAMNALEALVAGQEDAASAAALTGTYIRLGLELQKQLQRYRAEGLEAAYQEAAKGFDLFLDRIAARPQGNTFASLAWVATMQYRLGDEQVAGSARPSAAANAHFEKAAQYFENLLARSGEFSDATAEALLEVRLQLATCRRRLGRYKAAIDVLVEVLTEKPTLVAAQREAALVYQEWGSLKDGYYTLAIAGARKRPGPDGRQQNLIWGWAMLSAKVQRDEVNFANEFHEARYNLALCRLLQARSRGGDEAADLLAKAERDIMLTALAKPDLGGPDWLNRYNDLFRQIQAARGASATGLPQDVLDAARDHEAARAGGEAAAGDSAAGA